MWCRVQCGGEVRIFLWFQRVLQRDPSRRATRAGLGSEVPAHPAPGRGGGLHWVRPPLRPSEAWGRQGPPQVVHLAEQTPEVALRSDGQDQTAAAATASRLCAEMKSIKYFSPCCYYCALLSRTPSVKENQSPGKLNLVHWILWNIYDQAELDHIEMITPGYSPSPLAKWMQNYICCSIIWSKSLMTSEFLSCDYLGLQPLSRIFARP